MNLIRWFLWKGSKDSDLKGVEGSFWVQMMIHLVVIWMFSLCETSLSFTPMILKILLCLAAIKNVNYVIQRNILLTIISS